MNLRLSDYGGRYVLLLLLLAIPGFATVAAPTTILENGGSIENWLIAGPFVRRPELTSNQLTSPSAFSHFCTDISHADEGLHSPITREIFGVKKIDFENLMGPVSGVGPEAVWYLAATIIKSKVPTVGYLIIANDDGIEIFINGEMVDQSTKSSSGVSPTWIVPVEFREGDNLLLARISNKSGRTGCGIEFIDNFEDAFRLSANRSVAILDSIVLSSPTGPALKLNTSLRIKKKYRTTVRRLWPDSCSSETEFSNLGGLPNCPAWNDIATALFEIEVEGIPQTVCKGDIRILAKQLQHRALETGSAAAETLKALSERIEILLKPENAKPNDMNWQLKVCSVLQQLYVDGSASNDLSPLNREIKLHAFRSGIDDSGQVYRCYYPKGGGNSPLPLIIIFPTVISASRPFIESPFIASHIAAVNMAKIADFYKVGILWVGYRNQPYGSLCEFTHIDEVMNDYLDRYPTDPEKICLLGTCSGGVTASMAAVEWPSRFAGLALHNPVIHRLRNSYKDGGADMGFAGYRNWLADMDPGRRLLENRMANTPILITNDYKGGEGGGDISLTLQFMAEARHSNRKINFIPIPPSFGQREEWDILFEWCSRQRREGSTGDSNGLRENNYKIGPVSFAFRDRFVVVFGTYGTDVENKRNSVIADAFAAKWRQTHFAECIVMSDVDFSKSNGEHLNLVLIGSAESNNAWRLLAPRLLSKYADERLLYRGKQIGLNCAAYVLIENHPDNAAKRIVLVESRDNIGLGYIDLDLSINGWYDYVTYGRDKDSRRVQNAGHYHFVRENL